MEQEHHPTKAEVAAGLFAVGGVTAILFNAAIIGLPLIGIGAVIYATEKAINVIHDIQYTRRERPS